MKVVSVNVGEPAEVLWKGNVFLTGIFKEPVKGRIPVRRLNLDGDRQADLSVHGGVTKAVYAYPTEHYAWWRGEFPDMELPWGMFGENLTVEGLDEGSLRIGDRLRVGSAELIVAEPRMPCFKLGVRFGRMDIVKRFLESRRSGFYLAVEREGDAAAGDAIERLETDARGVTVRDIVRVHVQDKDDVETMRRALEIPVLPEQWRREFSGRLGSGAGGDPR
jgi:MOSC domain-containing protein YiiM